MNQTRDIELLIIYCSKQDRGASFHDIVQQRGLLDIEDYDINRFWNMPGGMEIIINGFNSIFRSTNFHCLVNVSSFLMHSLYWLKRERSEWFGADETFPDDGVIRTTGNEFLRLQRGNEAEVILSFTSVKSVQPGKRGEQYFENIPVRKNDWRNAVIEGC